MTKGKASYYEHPGRTASGEVYNPDKLTAAHKSLPFGTRMRVVNLDNGKAVVVRINDRTPPKFNYVIDLSRGSARALGITKEIGVASVVLYRLHRMTPMSSNLPSGRAASSAAKTEVANKTRPPLAQLQSGAAR